MSTSLSQSSLLTNLKYKEEYVYWTQQKLISFLESIQREEIKAIIQTIKDNNYQINDLMNMRPEEIQKIFTSSNQLLNEIINHFKIPYTLQSSNQMVRTEEVDETYQFNTQNSITDTNNNKSQQIENSLNIREVKTQHSASSTRIIDIYDYDNYPKFYETTEMFEQIEQNKLFDQLQKEKNNYIKKNISIQLKLQLSQNFNDSIQVDNTQNVAQFLQQLNEISKDQIAIEFLDCDKMYYICDKGGAQSSYVKFKQNAKIPLFTDSIFRIGSCKFLLSEILYDKEEAKVILKDISAKQKGEQQFVLNIYKYEKFVLGTSLNSYLGEKLKQHTNIKFNHCYLYYDGNYIHLKNYEENDTWIQLSKQNMKSHYQSLRNVQLLMLGEQILQVSINTLFKNQKSKQIDKILGDIDITNCSNCQMKEIKIIFNPCKHRTICQQCYKTLKPQSCSFENCNQQILNFYLPS